MLRAIFIFVMVLFPAAAPASETLPVRAGEHGEYSRLVIPAAPEDWRIATSDRKVEIALPGKDYEFELSDILEKRKAHRVLSARVVDSAETRSLVLTLTCDCPVRTSKGDEGLIVIDIFNDGPTPLVPADPQTGPTQAMLQAANQEQSAETSTSESMRAARDRMIALLAEARHQGVVQLKIDEEDETKNDIAQNTQPNAAVEPAQASYTAPEFDPAPSRDAPLTHETRLDPPQITPAVNGSDADCIDPSVFYNAAGDAGVLDYSSIASLRQQFETSTDPSERDDLARALALGYIHIGFFEEAYAIAGPRASGGDHDMAAAAAVANLAAGAARRAHETIAPYTSCGPFFEMLTAAAARAEDETAPAMTDAHIESLNMLTRAARGPVAETLALNAVERGDETLARVVYAIAKEARNGEQSPALAILEKALGAPGEETAAKLKAQITETAQTPGPLQSKALALLSEDYEKQAQIAYEGFLDDLAQQTAKREMSVSDARASFSGAKALAAAGRLGEGVAVLNASAQSAPGAAPAAQAVARSMIIDALLADDETRLKAIKSYFQHQEFVGGEGGSEVSLAVARELSGFGAKYLVEDALRDVPASWSADINLIKAQTALNAGDPSAALEFTAQAPETAALLALNVKAHERLGDSAGALAAVKNAVKKDAASDAMSRAAWRGQDWPLAMEAFAKSPAKDRTKGAAARISLAALNAGLKSIPATAREALSQDAGMLAAITHMFAPAPAVNVRAIDVLADYSTGVARETNFMQEGLGDE
ncbi:hypothetical protein [Hyphococcus sp.]|uniref:hypothetical protein n=1 Tax=Hyphococcus sp. TaxID=2038636 RepID=UPI003CCC0C58